MRESYLPEIYDLANAGSFRGDIDMIRYEQFDAAGHLRRTWLQRLELAYLYPGDITRLFERAGFENIKIAGAFDGRPFQHDTDELVIEAVRA